MEHEPYSIDENTVTELPHSGMDLNPMQEQTYIEQDTPHVSALLKENEDLRRRNEMLAEENKVLQAEAEAMRLEARRTEVVGVKFALKKFGSNFGAQPWKWHEQMPSQDLSNLKDLSNLSNLKERFLGVPEAEIRRVLMRCHGHAGRTVRELTRLGYSPLA